MARRKTPGDLQQLQAILWEGMEALDKFCKLAQQANDSQELRSLMHCLTQSAGVYAKILEAGSLDEIDALRERVHALEESRISA